jgi:hypothetical protein
MFVVKLLSDFLNILRAGQTPRQVAGGFALKPQHPTNTPETNYQENKPKNFKKKNLKILEIKFLNSEFKI